MGSRCRILALHADPPIRKTRPKFRPVAASSLRKQKRRVGETPAPERSAKPIVEVIKGDKPATTQESEMSTPIHSERSLLLQTQASVARAHALAVRKLPVAMTLSAIILSIINVKL